MKTVHDWALSSEPYAEQRAAGRRNPARRVFIDGGYLTIGAGGLDAVDVFTEHGHTFVVSVNQGLGYAGLEVFDEDGQPAGDVFVQGVEVADAIGPRGVDLHPQTIARRLFKCIA